MKAVYSFRDYVAPGWKPRGYFLGFALLSGVTDDGQNHNSKHPRACRVALPAPAGVERQIFPTPERETDGNSQ